MSPQQNNKKHRVDTVITAHTNADFDALAAIIAASKLYPGAALVFPGSQEKTLRNFFMESATYFFNFQNVKDIDLDSVTTLVVVDTRQRSRLPHVKALLERDDVAIHAYDHHPDSDDDLPYSTGIVKPWGATTSILSLEMRDKGMDIIADEATMLGCGIYEDTGSFTFSSTTEHDFQAAAWLRSQGMDLNVIADVLHRDLSAEQISILNELLESAATHEINGVTITMAEVSLEHYVGDFALLVHKMLDIQNIRTLFAMGRMQDRIVLVARSRTPDVNVGHICSSFGGGGHQYAASATIKDRTLSQIKDELFALLYTHINPQLLVKDIMSTPAVTVEASASIAQAVELMNRFALKAVPVVETGTQRCAGVLDNIIATRALAHELGDIAVEEYMLRECSVVTPHSDLYPVIETIIGQRQRLAPVVEDGNVTGVITRTDLINTLIEEPARIPESLQPEKSRERSVRSLMRERLPDHIMELLQQAGEMGQVMDVPVYVVGGFVRDLLLRRVNQDLDLVVEGDGIAFARALAKRLDGRVRSHKKFKTAVLIYTPEHGSNGSGGEKHIDVATARLEYYEYPAALPTVELSSIKMDLYRRDFTINALAIQLNPGSFGKLVDFFKAQRDIKERNLRVLHSLSFVEDPTRILRAIRFEQRYDFQIGKQTLRLIKNAVQLKLLQKLSGSRLFHEFKLILEEEHPLACLRSMAKLELLAAIHPKLKLVPRREKLLEEVDRVLTWYRLLYVEPQPEAWQVYLLGLCSGWEQDEVAQLVKRFALSPRLEKEFLSLRVLVYEANEKVLYWNSNSGPMSQLFHILENMPPEGVLFLMARCQRDAIKRSISHYLTALRGASADIGGKELIAMGLEPGPAIGEILNEVLAAKIDGQAPAVLDQMALAERRIREKGLTLSF